MSQVTLNNAPDLRSSYPRSPNDLVGDYILLGRILDKCRAVLAGTNGEYNYNCPLDRRFFDFTGVDANAFKDQVAQGKTDEEMLAWVKANSAPRSEDEILAWSHESRWAQPTEPAMRAHFERTRREIAPDRPYIQSWFQLLDTEEGRY